MKQAVVLLFVNTKMMSYARLDSMSPYCKDECLPGWFVGIWNVYSVRQLAVQISLLGKIALLLSACNHQHTHIHMHVHVHVHSYTHTCTYTHTHTHTLYTYTSGLHTHALPITHIYPCTHI